MIRELGRDMYFIKRSRQQGSALIVSLIFMLLLTIIGVGAMQSATLQERMAGNTRDIATAFEAAEAAASAAEENLRNASIVFDGTHGLYTYCAVGATGTCPPDWRNRNSVGWVKTANTLSGVSDQPEYIIEKVSSGTVNGGTGSLASDINTQAVVTYYRITARGFGSSNNTMAVIQTTFRGS